MAAGRKRQLNYELLRIMAMLMIVCLHYLSKGGLLGNPARAEMTAAGFTAWLVEAFCLVAVNVYVLISGYFGVDAPGSAARGKKITCREALRRPLRIWKQVFFYSVLFGFGAIAFGVQEFDPYQVLTYCFPVVTEHYWFATAYVILCLLMPFLNAAFTYMDQRELRYLLFGFLLIFCISKTVIPVQLPWDKYGYDSLWFVVLYLTGACLKRCETPLVRTRLQALALYLGSMLAVFASFLVLRAVFLRTGRLENLISYGYSYNFLFCYTGAVGLFLMFQESGASREDPERGGWLERFRKPVELFSGATFGVYLIHEHINIRPLWTALVPAEALLGGSAAGLLAHMAVCVLCVYLVCTAVELVRQKGGMTALPALILLVYPLRHVMTGLDMMDAGYALGNYRFFDSLNQMWKLATYLANITGVLLSKLPFGDRWIGMNVYCGLLVGLAAAGVYLYIQKKYGQKRKLFCFLLFAAEMTALSLCWAPGVILYHYLGYLLMTAAVLVLSAALAKEGERKKRTYFVVAGVILGLCVAVRMPNVTYMALILPVWCDCFWNRGRTETAPGWKNTWFGMLVTRTLYCAGGYLAGLLTPLIVICARYGMTAYPQMIASLFGMTDHASDYKPVSMVTAMFEDYFRYSAWLFLFAGYLASGLLFFWGLNRLLSARLQLDGAARTAAKKKITYAFEVLYVLGLLVVLRFCYGRGMFDFDYSDYFSMYKWVTVYLLIVMALCVWVLFYKAAGRDLKLWAVFLPVIILVTPLGSNNWLYPIMNNLFLVMPVSIVMLEALFQKSGRFEWGGAVFRITLGFMIVCTAVQSVLFGIGFVFHDRDVRKNNDCVRIDLQCGDAGNGLATTAEKKRLLEELDAYLYQNGLNEKRVILYGDIPAVAYLFDMEPAIFTTWADLDSNSIEMLEEDLGRLSATDAPDALPLIIMGRPSAENLSAESGLAYQKLERIKDFAAENGYGECFRNEAFIVFCVEPDL